MGVPISTSKQSEIFQDCGNSNYFEHDLKLKTLENLKSLKGLRGFETFDRFESYTLHVPHGLTGI